MGKGRVEAFSDGVIAIIITIMVLEMKTPHGADLEALRPILPTFLSYVLSFVYVGIYWNNHHHLFHAVKRVTGGVLWANLHLLFWLSLFPFVTSWMDQTHFGSMAVAAYGIVLFLAAFAWEIVRRTLLGCHDNDSPIVRAVTGNVKEWISLGLYAAGIALAFVNPIVSCLLYGIVAGIWVTPDRRIERVLAQSID